ncbi:MAG: DUF937 domain-containing protein [Labilithrix sp.]|nr:DUF937 domain-containing protein [Labilithrix sp.]
MAFNLVRAVEARLSPKTVEHVASHIGEDTTTTRGAMSTGVLAIVGGFAKSASSPTGSADLLARLRAAPEAGASDEELDRNAPEGLHERGQTLIAGHFGGGAARLADAVASATGLGRHQGASVVSMLAPLVTGVLAREVVSRRIDAVGLSKLLGDERAAILARGGLPGGLGELLGGERVATAGAPAIAATPDVPEPVPHAAAKPDVPEPVPHAAAKPDVPEPVPHAAPARPPASDVKTPAAPKAHAAASDERRKSPVGWIVGIAAAAALLVLGLLFSSSQRPEHRGVETSAPAPETVTPAPELPRGPMVPNLPAPAAPPEPTSQTTTTGAVLGPAELDKHFDATGPTPDRLETPLTFDLSKAELSGDGANALERIATLMQDHPTTRIRLDGLASGSGDRALDETLARDRAERVKAMLVERGVEQGRIETGTLPPEPAAPAEGRRVAIVIIAR